MDKQDFLKIGASLDLVVYFWGAAWGKPAFFLGAALVIYEIIIAIIISVTISIALAIGVELHRSNKRVVICGF